MSAYRPQAITKTRFNTDINDWETCSDSSDCFADISNNRLSYPVLKGRLGTPKYSKIALEWQVDCAASDQKGAQARVTLNMICNFQYWFFGTRTTNFQRNANVRMWYNYKEITGTSTICDGRTWTLTNILDAHKQFRPKQKDLHSIVRVELSRASGSSIAHTHFLLMMDGVPSSFDVCTNFQENHGQCLKELTGKNVPLRSNHTLQLQCLEAADGDAIIGTIQKCDAWRACFARAPSPEGKTVLTNMLLGLNNLGGIPSLAQLAETGEHSKQQVHSGRVRSGLSGLCPGSTSISGIDDPDHRTCTDPRTFDIEAFDCNCWDHITDKTPHEINQMACENTDVCCDWKQSHCTQYSLMEARSQNAQPEEKDASKPADRVDNATMMIMRAMKPDDHNRANVVSSSAGISALQWRSGQSATAVEIQKRRDEAASLNVLEETLQSKCA
jgi:hypothetical protein